METDIEPQLKAGEPGAPLWQPNDLAATHMHRFMQLATEQTGRSLADWPTLYDWSIAHPAEFWSAVADYTGIYFSRRADDVVVQPLAMPGAEWFCGAQLNFAENLLLHTQSEAPLVFCDESGRRIALSSTELHAQVAAVAAGMRAAGIEPGDRVAAMLPNCPEAVITMLAAASIGAVFSSCSPDFGVQGVIGRFSQIEPRLLFVCDGYAYGGKQFNCTDKTRAIAAAIGSLERIIVVPFLQADAEEPEAPEIPQAVSYADFSIAGIELQFTQLPFSHPLFILYSSGTTGMPKCIVHSAGGTLLQHQKELQLHTDLQPHDVIFYYTTCGWMMWNWLVSALHTGARVVLYDGSPFYPDANALWRLAAEEGVTVFGTSPRFLLTCEKEGLQPAAEFDLAALRTILSTGAPLAERSFRYVAESLSSGDSGVQLSSISGGTDLISCFALGNPLLPVYPGELQSPGLGMAVNVFDPKGTPLAREAGELVCTQSFPSMPVRFWNDPQGDKYRAAYFERFPGVWAQGDQAVFTEHGGLRVLGRSDAVLNPGGVRIGSAEITEPALSVPEVVEAMAIGMRRDAEEEILLFVVLRDGVQMRDSLREQIAHAIRSAASPRHLPAGIHAVPEIPRTISGKPVELAVRSILHAEPVLNLEALANPAALEYFRRFSAT